MSELSAKRAEAMRKLRAVQQKQSRLRRNNNAEVRGTKLDVTVERTKLKRYNGKQLDAFIARAEGFLDRRVQVYGSSSGELMSGDRVRYLAKLEGKVTNMSDNIMSQIGDMTAPFTGMTLRERDQQMRPTVKAGGEVITRTFEPLQTKAQYIRNTEALDKFIARAEDRLRPERVKERVQAGRDQLGQMLITIGAHDRIEVANNLTDEQFFVFWEYGPYAGDVAILYDIMKRSNENQEELRPEERDDMDNINAELDSALQWAGGLPTDTDLSPQQARRQRPPQGRGKAR